MVTSAEMVSRSSVCDFIPLASQGRSTCRGVLCPSVPESCPLGYPVCAWSLLFSFWVVMCPKQPAHFGKGIPFANLDSAQIINCQNGPKWICTLGALFVLNFATLGKRRPSLLEWEWEVGSGICRMAMARPSPTWPEPLSACSPVHALMPPTRPLLSSGQCPTDSWCPGRTVHFVLGDTHF